MSSACAIGISGTGSFVPPTTVSNSELAGLLDTRADAIERVTGVRQRRLRDARENIYVMGAVAGLRALEDAGLTPADVDAIYCASDPCGELAIPAAAAVIQHLMGLPALRAADGAKAANFCPACDLVAGCSGPLFALEAAVGRVLTRRSMHGRDDVKVLVIAGDSASNVVDWRDRETAVLFADGFGAAVVEALPVAARRGALDGDSISPPAGIVALHTATDGSKADAICQFSVNSARSPTAGVPATELVEREYVRMKGAEVYRHAVRRLSSSLDAALAQAGLTRGAVDLFVPHQANLQILRAVFGDGVLADPENERDEIEVYTRGVVREGNTSAGTLLTALDRLHRCGRLRPGMTLALPTFGAGMSWGTLVLRWHKAALPRMTWDELDAAQNAEAGPRVAALHAAYGALEEKMRAAGHGESIAVRCGSRP